MMQTRLAVLVLVAVACIQVRSETSQRTEDDMKRSSAQDSLLRFLRRQHAQRQYTSDSVTEYQPVYCKHGNYCPANHTCCRGHSGYWACCPLLNATCCPDGVHCCPSGYHCSMITRKCQRRDSDEMSYTKNVPALKVETEKNVPDQTPTFMEEDARRAGDLVSMEKKDPSFTTENKIVIPDRAPVAAVHDAGTAHVYCDRSHVCPSGNTCCKQRTGTWACCTLPKATCCQDGFHCCPNGYRCNVVGKTCYKNDDDIIPILKKKSAKTLFTADEIQTKVHDWPQNSIHDNSKINPHKNLDANFVEHLEVPPPNMMQGVLPERTYCNGSHYCPDHYTCCHSRFGHWSCCPGLQATCCYDGIHCCPRYLRCDVIRNRCVKSDGSSSEWADLQPIEGN